MEVANRSGSISDGGGGVVAFQVVAVVSGYGSISGVAVASGCRDGSILTVAESGCG